MTLTRFFTKYVYIPLGGSRRGRFRTYLNVLIVFLVSGIWHGANWTFILWGVINGIGNIFDKVFGRFFKWVPRAVGVLVTFIFSTLAWSIFRAESISQALKLWGRLKFCESTSLFEQITETFNNLIEIKFLYRAGFGSMIDLYPAVPLLIFVFIILLACFFMRNTQEKAADGRYNGKRIAVTVILMVWSILSLSDVSEFLYFNF
jgi:hypothetical protein